MNILQDIQKPHGSAPTDNYDTVIVGAGPYGLSTAAHLQAQGLKVAIFGKPLQLWRDHMPKGMLVRSFWWASNLSDPHKRYGFKQFFLEQDPQFFEKHERLGEKPKGIDPLTIETFVEYGLWFQKHAVPNVDETFVTNIEHKDRSFEVTLADGRIVHSSTVVMAPGLAYYTYRPPEYSHLPSELVSHASEHPDFEGFTGKRVVVIGAGQSALESAALLNEAGAEVHVVHRSPITWLEVANFKNRPLKARIRAPKAGIAAGWDNWLIEHFPYTFQCLPRSTKDNFLQGRGRHGPAGSHWLKDRIIGKVTLHELQQVQQVKEGDEGVMLTLSNGQTLTADHVLLGTGYRTDIKRLPMLSPSLETSIQTYQDAPVLNNWFESSVPGLYFIGFSSLSSFGPFFRFIVGTEAAARRVTTAVSHRVRNTKREVEQGKRRGI